ncbi:hypothetical protein Tco_0045251 [Tanacetum coccineum]
MTPPPQPPRSSPTSSPCHLHLLTILATTVTTPLQSSPTATSRPPSSSNHQQHHHYLVFPIHTTTPPLSPQRPTRRACLAVEIAVRVCLVCHGFMAANATGAFGCPRQPEVWDAFWVVDSTAKGAFCFELDPHRVRLAATAARDVWRTVEGAASE